jgi:purine catabolism regulator
MEAPASAAPITVADCMRLSPLGAADVVAGREGLGREVRWVHVVDVPNVEECLVGGELVMTSGISLGHDQSLQRRIVPAMEAMDLAGLVVAIGPYVDRVPAPVVEAADERRIPVLALPWEVNFRDVTQAVLTAIVARQQAMLELSERVHRGLTRLVLEGGGLPELTRLLSDLLRRSTIALDPGFQVLAGALTAGAGDAARTALAAGRPAPRVVARLRAAARRSGASASPTLLADHDLSGVLAPIVVERRLHGFLWIDGRADDPEPLNVVAAEHGATVAALLLYKEDAVRRAERRLERDALDLLLDGVAPDPEGESATRLLPPAAGYTALALQPRGVDPAVAEAMAETALARAGAPARVRWRAQHLLVIMPAPDAPRLADLIVVLREALAGVDGPPSVGVSREVRSLVDLGPAATEAREALRIGALVDGAATVHFAETMATLLRLTRGQPREPRGGPASPLARLAEHDAAHGTNLVATLDGYLQLDGNVSAEARALGVHRHTLLNRLERIETLSGVDLSPASRLDLRLALLIFRLSGQAESFVRD